MTAVFDVDLIGFDPAGPDFRPGKETMLEFSTIFNIFVDSVRFRSGSDF